MLYKTGKLLEMAREQIRDVCPRIAEIGSDAQTDGRRNEAIGSILDALRLIDDALEMEK